MASSSHARFATSPVGPIARKLLRHARRLQRVAAMHVGQISSTRPLSADWGFDHGTPIDRYYIEAFLDGHSDDIRGAVLEVTSDLYSRRFGGAQVTESHIVDVDNSNPSATIVGDLAEPGTLPQAAFDCVILTQTLQYFLDVGKALKQIRASLRPGGVALLTVPGITAVGHDVWDDGFCWAFTVAAMRRLLSEVFDESSIQVNAFGNLYAATAFLHGAAFQEVNEKKLEPVDPNRAVVICARAQA